jgi:hypothetical protein
LTAPNEMVFPESVPVIVPVVMPGVPAIEIAPVSWLPDCVKSMWNPPLAPALEVLVHVPFQRPSIPPDPLSEDDTAGGDVTTPPFAPVVLVALELVLEQATVSSVNARKPIGRR